MTGHVGFPIKDRKMAYMAEDYLKKLPSPFKRAK